MTLIIRPINHAPTFVFSSNMPLLVESHANISLGTSHIVHSIENEGNTRIFPFAHVLSLGGPDEEDQMYTFDVVSVNVLNGSWSVQVNFCPSSFALLLLRSIIQTSPTLSSCANLHSIMCTPVCALLRLHSFIRIHSSTLLHVHSII